MVPNSRGTKQLKFDSRVYSCQFSSSGNFCYVSTQDHRVTFYDTCNLDHFTRMGRVRAAIGQWTITDCHLSMDSQYLAYSSITPFVHLCKLEYDGDRLVGEPTQTPLSMATDDDGSFGIWSLKFSDDGQRIVIGTSSATIQLYDIPTQTTLHCINGHTDDVNAVAFAEAYSSNVLLSGSDDTTIKVWDTRSFGQGSSGVLVGHTEGITFVSSKGDGRYLLSNGKDQTMKLWDMRQLISTKQYNKKYARVDLTTNFDYRWMQYPRRTARKHPADASVRTFSGHSVLKTLIRCYFSPQHSTGQRYAYTGCAQGRVHVFDLESDDYTIIDTAHLSNRPITNQDNLDEWETETEEEEEPQFRRGRLYETPTVRDVSWHPHQPVILSSQWNNDSNGLVIKHDFEF
ncbi:WD40-repeat-containing domain protein [Gorgonomyces haynaldii]|nr:WD40-repeat-containing domain protein [Gorgonomyces haynaldii]